VLLVGSKALEMYIPLNRVIHDWDIYMTEIEFDQFMVDNNQYLVKQTPHTTLFDIKGTLVEVKRESQFEPTDKYIFDNGVVAKTQTEFGLMCIPKIQIIYDMKQATALCIDEWKHTYDLKLIQKANFGLEENSQLFKDRLVETRARIARSNSNKFKFFHRTQYDNTKIATIPEYIVHDKLHEMIADLINVRIPTYLRIINGDVEVDMRLFNKLSHEQKLYLMVEESLVLALERWFIPQMVENGINYRLIDRFYNNNEAGATYQILKHVNIKGLKGEDADIVSFGRKHFNEIEILWKTCKERIAKNEGFPKWFFDEIFVAREKYKKGEQVGIHHDRY